MRLNICKLSTSLTGDSDTIRVVGSDAATTCCVLLLRHARTGHVSVAHYDGDISQPVARTLIDELLQLAGEPPRAEPQLHCTLVGCYDDEQDCSRKVAKEILGRSAQLSLLQELHSTLSLPLSL